MNNAISTPALLESAIQSTYLYSAIAGIVVVLLMIVCVNMVAWQPGRVDNSGNTRRVICYLMGVVALLAPIIMSYFLFMERINKPAFADRYRTHMLLGGMLALVVYVGISLIVISMQSKKTKLYSIFPRITKVKQN